MSISVDRIQGLSGGLAIKAPCRAATTASIAFLNGLPTVDGVALVAGDRVLVKDQADPKQNGIYTADTGDWKRALDFNGPNDVVDGTWILVREGAGGERIFSAQSTDSLVIPGVSGITFTESVTAQLGLDLASTEAGKGDAGIGVKLVATGAVARTQHDKNSDMVSAKDFGASPANTVAANTTAFQAALDKGDPVFVPDGEYTCGALSVPSGAGLFGSRKAVLKLANGTNADFITLATSATDASVVGITLDCNKANQTGTRYGIVGSSNARPIVRNCRILNATTDAVRLAASTGASVVENTIDTPGEHGVTMTTGAADFVVAGNVINDPAGAGVIFSAGNRGSIVGNVIEAGGPSGDGITGYDDTNYDVTVVGNVINSSTNHGIHVGGNRIVVGLNTVNGSTQSGIYVGAHVGGSSANAAATSYDCAVIGNTVNGSGLYGVHLLNCDNSKVSESVVRGSVSHQILLDTCVDTTASGNKLKAGSAGGVTLRGSTDCTVVGNTTKGHTTGDAYRLESKDAAHSTGNTIAGNKSIGDNRAFIEATGADDNHFQANRARSTVSTTYVRVGASSTFEHNKPDLEDVASAATIVISPNTKQIKVTGTTTITSINGPRWEGRRITLYFTDTVTLGGNINNIRLNGGTNFSAVAGNTMTLVSDGTNWREAGRGTAPA